MDLDDVRIFNKVIELGSFTQAATFLGLPKSTVSRRVSNLEAALGVQLLFRTTRRLQLTQAGSDYHRRTSRAIEELEEATRQAEEAQAEVRGVLRMTVPGDLSGALPRMIADFQRRYPQVAVVVFSTGRRVDLVAEGYDLALRAGFLEDSTLVAKKLLSSRALLFASRSYVDQHGQPSHPRELASHNCLIFSNEQTNATWMLKGPEGVVEVDVKGNLASRDFNLLRSATAQGLGIGLLPELSVQGDAEGGSLVRFLPSYQSRESGLYAVYPPGRYVPPRVRAFVDLATEWLAGRSDASHGLETLGAGD